jgi:hypothetical protein
MSKEWMFAHKLCALISRYKQRDIIANRDLFDIRFFEDSGIVPYIPIVLQRFETMLGHPVTMHDVALFMLDFLQVHQQRIQKNILDGLGELVDEQAKNDIKKNLLLCVCEYLKMYI